MGDENWSNGPENDYSELVYNSLEVEIGESYFAQPKEKNLANKRKTEATNIQVKRFKANNNPPESDMISWDFDLNDRSSYTYIKACYEDFKKAERLNLSNRNRKERKKSESETNGNVFERDIKSLQSTDVILQNYYKSIYSTETRSAYTQRSDMRNGQSIIQSKILDSSRTKTSHEKSKISKVAISKTKNEDAVPKKTPIFKNSRQGQYSAQKGKSNIQNRKFNVTKKIKNINLDFLLKEMKNAKVTCSGCQTNFDTRQELSDHTSRKTLKLTDGSKVLQCSLFSTAAADLSEYAEEDTVTNQVACKLCQFVGASKAKAWEHVHNVHTRLTKFICKQCQHEACSVKGISAHLKAEHGFAGRTSKTTSGVGEFLCHLCTFKTNREKNLDRHVKQVHLKIRDYCCPGCSHSFAKKYAHAKHVSANTDYNYNGPDNMFCSRYTRMQYDWSTVYKYEPEWDAYTCLVCGTVKNLKCRMEEHAMYKHINFAPYACKKCDQSCKSQREMLTHVQTVHSDTISPLLDLFYGEPKDEFKCGQCQFKGNNTLSLKRHIKQEHG